MSAPVGWIEVAEVRDRLTVAMVLVDAGCEVPRTRRAACPIHRGDNRTAFSISRDGRWWTCWSHCGSGDALLLARKLNGLEFRGALQHCAALVGVTAQRRTPAEIADARARREQEQLEHEMARLHCRDRWIAALREFHDAQGNVHLHGAILRHDPELMNPRLRTLFDSLGDPFLREVLAEQLLDAIEAEERAEREGGHRVAA